MGESLIEIRFRSSFLRVDSGEELRPKIMVACHFTGIRGSDGPASLLADAANHHAELLGVQDATGAPGSEMFHERRDHFLADLFLENKAVGETVYETRDVGEPDDTVTRNVSHLCEAVVREQMVWTHGMKKHVAYDHQALIRRRRRSPAEDIGGVPVVTVEKIVDPHIGGPDRSVEQLGIGSRGLAQRAQEILESLGEFGALVISFIATGAL